MSTNFRPAQTGYSRVFLIEGRARPDHKPAYQANMKAGGLTKSFGDIERIEIPSPYEFGKYLEVGVIRGADERATIDLVGRYAADLKSEMLRLAVAGCPLDVHINFGVCTDPTDYNTFTKKIVLENAILTEYSSDELGALGSDEGAKVDETISVSAKDIYELVQVSVVERGGDLVTNEILDTARCDTPSCGDCTVESDGCGRWFAISAAAGGSPSTPADVAYDAGDGVIRAHDISSLGAAEAPNQLDCLGDYLVVVSAASNSLHYALLSEFDTLGTVPTWTEVGTGFVGIAGGPRAIWSNGRKAFIAGTSGYIWSTEDPTTGVTVLDAGVANPLATYNAIHGLDENFAVAVGNAGVIAKTDNGTTWGAVTPPPVGIAVNFNTVVVMSKDVWLVGASNGFFYYTIDGGASWTAGTRFPGSGTGAVNFVEKATDTVLYMAHTISSRAYVLRSTNGGYDWERLPEGSGRLPLADRINSIAACAHNADVFVAGGLGDNGTDGILMLGTD